MSLKYGQSVSRNRGPKSEGRYRNKLYCLKRTKAVCHSISIRFTHIASLDALGKLLFLRLQKPYRIEPMVVLRGCINQWLCSRAARTYGAKACRNVRGYLYLYAGIKRISENLNLFFYSKNVIIYPKLINEILSKHSYFVCNISCLWYISI